MKKFEDDRATWSWPISPPLKEEMMSKVDIKFTAIDAFDMWDNVYFESKAGKK